MIHGHAWQTGRCLHRLRSTHHKRQARLLLDSGADPNQVNSDEGVSPMHLAAGLGITPLCLLVQYNGDPNIRVEDGTTPVHVAAIWGYADCMQILLANGGDPFLRDQEGFSAIELARTYQHEDVLQVLQYYMFLLSSVEDQTMTPMYTYKRLSTDSASSQASRSPSDCSYNCTNCSLEDDNVDSMYNTRSLEDYLQEFAHRRHSSIYMSNVQKQVDRFFCNGRKTHIVDVTSPDHPYVESRTVVPIDGSPDCDPGDSLHLHLSLSDIWDQSTSSDTFVTCDGEDLDSIKQNEYDISLSCCGSSSQSALESLLSPGTSPLSVRESNTVIKNPKYISNIYPQNSPHSSRSLFSKVDNTLENGEKTIYNRDKKRSGEYRGVRYCERKPPSLVQSQDLYNMPEKCDFCGGIAEKYISDGTVCATCEKLGLELDQLVGVSLDSNTCKITTLERNVFDSCAEMENSEYKSSRTGFNIILPDLLQQLPEKRESSEQIQRKQNKISIEGMKGTENDKDSRMPASETSSRQPTSILPNDINDLTHRLERTKFESNNISRNRVHTGTANSDVLNIAKLDDSIVSRISSTVNELDRACLLDSVLTTDDTYLDRMESVPEKYTKPYFNKVDRVNNTKQTLNAINIGNVDIDEDKKENAANEGCRDLWTQVSECKHAKLIQRGRRDILDTAFCGRESMSSIVSDASTVDYVYTDTENGIALIERHLPSLCGSQGSRQSVDSHFSVGTNEAVDSDSDVSRRVSGRISNSSQDTVLYNWRENAILKSDNSGNGSSRPNSYPLIKLDDDVLRSKLCCLGDDPGPVTKTTRPVYLTRLSQLENDPDCKLLTRKPPDFPPELRQAFGGNLDMSEMANLETKMVATFQKPDRQRRWREGTLKSSFNYILLDPRITKNLPNRACNLSDQDLLQTFISAMFYIGKGKRSRPYSHLYEAIKLQKKKADKVSSKVEKILDIWDGGLGVVSLHCFQSVIPVEAYTREACMVDAVGLNHLTNMKRGDYYGVSVTFSMKQRRKMGVYLLQKALQIFLAEGERQIAPLDIKNE